ERGVRPSKETVAEQLSDTYDDDEHMALDTSGACFLRISAPEIVLGMSGESEKKLLEPIGDAVARVPSTVFIDETDAVTPKRKTSPVLIIGSTLRPDALDSALQRVRCFDREIALGIADEAARESLLDVLGAKMRLDGSFDSRAIAKKMPGYDRADLVSLTKEAAVIAVNHTFSTMLALTPLGITMADVVAVVDKVQRSAKREGISTTPDATWADIG
ncbi:hypothetical protein PybrP1_010975, partial [[Pythium] brassicae (nom. inval.)]